MNPAAAPSCAAQAALRRLASAARSRTLGERDGSRPHGVNPSIMKRFAAIALVLGASPALAHDTWLLPARFHVEPGQVL